MSTAQRTGGRCMSDAPRPEATMSGNPLPLKAIHHVELLVGNAKQAAYYYRHAFGFSQLAYAGPGNRRPRAGVVRARPGRHSPGGQHAAVARRSDVRASAAARRRRARYRVSGRRRRRLLRRGRAPRRASRAASRTTWPTTSAASAGPRSAPTATRCIRSFRLADYSGPFLPGYQVRRSPPPAPGWNASTTSSATSKTAA